jgi:hypothetical protein
MFKIASSVLITALTALAQTDAPIPEYEEPPALKAADILKPEFAAGPNHRVLEKVTTFDGRNRYAIETPWGYFIAEGDAMLLSRMAEANAMAEMKQLMTTDEYQAALKVAEKSPEYTANIRALNLAGALRKTEAGMSRIIGGGNEAAKAEKATAGQLDGAVQALKRGLAIHYGTDPYSTNETYQDQLERVALTGKAGGVTFKLTPKPVGSEAGLELTTENLTQNFQETLRGLSPHDLRTINRRALVAMKTDEKIADLFLKQPVFSPTRQTAVVRALDSLVGVKNRGAFVTLATRNATVEPDARFYSGTAQLLAKLHSEKDKLAALATLGDLPVAIAEDGRLIIALQWDTAFWSYLAERFIERASAAKLGQKGAVVVVITGTATPRFKAELEKRKIGLVTNAFGGPQK